MIKITVLLKYISGSEKQKQQEFRAIIFYHFEQKYYDTFNTGNTYLGSVKSRKMKYRGPDINGSKVI